MTPDPEMLKALVSKLSNHKASVPVFRILDRRIDELEHDTIETTRHFIAAAGFGEMRYKLQRDKDATTVQFQEGIRARVFHASGAMSIQRGWRPLDKLLATHADRADLDQLRREAEAAVRRLQLVPQSDAVRFERLWKLKAAAITRDSQRAPVALARVVGAFRRFLSGLPVWGRASAFVEIAAENQIAAAGVDWRPVTEKAVETAKVLAPDEAAHRVLNELQTFLPGERYTRKHYTPDFFSLGYFSLPKRRAQSFMQPVYVAMFKPAGPVPSIGRVIVVPAAPHAYESIARPLAYPPVTTRKADIKTRIRKPVSSRSKTPSRKRRAKAS